MANKKYQVFVSSTYKDLIEERKRITQALLQLDCIPAGMELFPASNQSQWDIIKKVIDESDYFLLIIGGRYGTTKKDEKGIEVSYTEMEFDYAMSKKKPIITLCIENRGELESSKVENNQEKLEMLDRFIKKASLAREVGYWSPKDPGKNISTIACIAIDKMKVESPAIGWVRLGAQNSENLLGPLCGEWSLNHIDGNYQYKDNLQISEHDKLTNRISGKVVRIKRPKSSNSPRDWDCLGIKIGENIASIYYSERDNSIGCSLLRHVEGQQYEGKYLRYNAKRHDIDMIDGIEMYERKRIKKKS